jgi:anti-sigma factor RsiW
MTCEKVRRLISRNLDADTDLADKRLIDQHVELCAACREALLQMQNVDREAERAIRRGISRDRESDDFTSRVMLRVEGLHDTDRKPVNVAWWVGSTAVLMALALMFPYILALGHFVVPVRSPIDGSGLVSAELDRLGVFFQSLASFDFSASTFLFASPHIVWIGAAFVIANGAMAVIARCQAERTA